jgi:hypothetical protein
MSTGQTTERAFEQFVGNIELSAFDMFTNDAYFVDENASSCDLPLPSVECGDDLPGNFFDSAIDVGLDIEGLHNDMSVWPVGDLLGCAEHLSTGPVEITSSSPQHTEVLPTPVPSPPSGLIEALWRPFMGSSPVEKVFPEFSTPSRAPAKARAHKAQPAVKAKASPKPKVSKVVKTTKPARTHKRTTSAPFGVPRRVQELYNLPWSHLSQEEKGLLLLPLLQGIDPNTGAKIDEAGSILPPPQFEMVREDVFGTGDDGANLIEKHYTPKTSSPAAIITRDIDTEDAAVFRTCNEFNKQFDLKKKQSGLPDFGFDIPNFQFDETNFDMFDNFMPADQGLGGPYGNGVIGAPVQKPTFSTNVNSNTKGNGDGVIGGDIGQMPTPSGEYGRKRQQEALKRNAMLRGADRRR